MTYTHHDSNTDADVKLTIVFTFAQYGSMGHRNGALRVEFCKIVIFSASCSNKGNKIDRNFSV